MIETDRVPVWTLASDCEAASRAELEESRRGARKEVRELPRAPSGRKTEMKELASLLPSSPSPPFPLLPLSRFQTDKRRRGNKRAL